MKHSIAPLRVGSDRRHLEYENGESFFYLADTAWELFHKLNRQEAFDYLENRARKGFNVIQAAILVEQDGLRRSNAYGRSPVGINRDGQFDPMLPDVEGEYSYWDHVDALVRKAAEFNLYMALFPAWQDKFVGTSGEGPHIFTPDKARFYGEWLGRRYASATNVIWVLGGDAAFTTRDQLEALNEMARGLRKGDQGRHLITVHSAAGHSSRESVGGEEWVDFHMIHSGHNRSRFNYRMIAEEYERYPFLPVLDGEANHEGRADNGNIAMGCMDDTDARRSAYWAVLSGACGHTYGHHSVAHFVTLPDKDTPKGFFSSDWREALEHPGSGQMKHLRTLIESVPFHEGTPAPNMVCGNMTGVNFVPVLKGKRWLIAYSAQGLRFDLMLNDSWNGANGRWFNPRTGDGGKVFPITANGVQTFCPPSSGRSEDWALLIQK